MKKLGIIVLMGLLAMACDNSVGGGENNGAAGNSNSNGSGALCGTDNPCPSGQFCYNGICAMGCNGKADCAADQYCDTSEFGDRLCHDSQVKSCPDTPCQSSQKCVNGLCSTPPTTTQCKSDQVMNGQDGCDDHAICLEDVDKVTKCYTFPSCAEDGSCPTGLIGAVCNNGYIPKKARICLTGVCAATENCPPNWKCFKLNPSDVLGMCSDGAPGSMCSVPSDCASNNCSSAGAGFPGVCM